MKILFPDHGMFRVFVDRGIDIDDIKKVIRNPLKTEPQSDGKIKVTGITSSGIALVVVYKSQSKNNKIVITAYHEN